ncbi:MAG: hypothetical protein KKC20_17435 [Proteobacteria bacterium]|nr:hypothetical protein [Pseudomonadota bacterium]
MKKDIAIIPAPSFLPILIGLFFVLVSLQAPAVHAGSKVEGDPMIKITCLPIKQNLQEIMAKISADVSRDTGLEERFVTYYWQTFDAIYCPGCEPANIKKPVFVDLYVPAFISEEDRKKIMTSLAIAIEKYTDYTRRDIFMHTHIAEKSQLFIMGNLVTNWKQVGGPDDTQTTDPKN